METTEIEKELATKKEEAKALVQQLKDAKVLEKQHKKELATGLKARVEFEKGVCKQIQTIIHAYNKLSNSKKLELNLMPKLGAILSTTQEVKTDGTEENQS